MKDAEQGDIYRHLPFLYFTGRVFLFIALVPDAFTWLGDLSIYYRLAQIPGWPFIDHWIEYPPVFPFLCELFHIASGGSEFIFTFLLTIFLAGAGAISIWLFSRIARQVTPQDALLRTLIYFSLLSVCVYTWWYYDILVVALILAANLATMNHKDHLSGLWIGLGILSKWFPALILPSLWRAEGWKRALRVTLIALGLTALVFGVLYLVSPQMTAASLAAQPGRSSWQTIWALLDGNMVTGAFIQPDAYLDPASAATHPGNPALIPGWLTLLIFGGLGLFLLLKARVQDARGWLAVQGFTWAIYLIWSPGWSPQWVLYLLPLLLLTLPVKTGLADSLFLLLFTLLEWPLLLGRHVFGALWVIAPLRVLLLAVFAWQWVRLTRQPAATPANPT